MVGLHETMRSTRITARSQESYLREVWLLGEDPDSSKEAVTILAFYFSDPFPLFLVQDHFSCKDAHS